MKTIAMFLLATAVAACGDDGGSTTFDAPVDHDAAPDSSEPAHERAVIVAGDFTPGNPGALTVIDVTTRAALPLSAPQGAVAEDPILRQEASELLVVNRNAGNNVTILNANTLALVEQLGTGANTNPQDVAVLGSKLFVPTMGNKGAVVLERGSSTVTEVDLSADDPDGKPNCMSVYKVGSKLFVACGMLDNTDQFLPPRGPGVVYVLDATTFAKTATLTLTTKNPIALFEQIPAGAPHGGDLLLPTVDFSTGEGCVERITTSGTPTAAGCLVDNSVLGNFAGRVGVYNPELSSNATAHLGSPLMFAPVATPDFTGSAFKTYDLTTDALTATTSAAAQEIGDLVVCPTSGALVVADKKMGASGLRVYAAGGGSEQTTAPLAVDLRPQSQHGLVCY